MFMYIQLARLPRLTPNGNSFRSCPPNTHFIARIEAAAKPLQGCKEALLPQVQIMNQCNH